MYLCSNIFCSLCTNQQVISNTWHQLKPEARRPVAHPCALCKHPKALTTSTHIHTPCSTWAGPLVFEQLLKLPDGVGLDWIYTSCQPDSYPQQRAHQHSGLKHEGVLLQSELSSPFSITSCTKLFLLSLFSAILFLFPL